MRAFVCIIFLLSELTGISNSETTTLELDSGGTDLGLTRIVDPDVTVDGGYTDYVHSTDKEELAASTTDEDSLTLWSTTTTGSTAISQTTTTTTASTTTISTQPITADVTTDTTTISTKPETADLTIGTTTTSIQPIRTDLTTASTDEETTTEEVESTPSSSAISTVVSSNTTPQSTSITTVKTKVYTHPTIKPEMKESTTIPLTLYINKTFDEDLKNKNSEKYKTFAASAQSTLQTKFRKDMQDANVTITVTGFRQGSIITSYEVTIPLRTKNTSALDSLTDKLLKAATDWKGQKILNESVDETRTKSKNNLTENDLMKGRCVCPVQYVCIISNSDTTCQHKCDSFHLACGEHGFCVYDFNLTKPVCHCMKRGNAVYYGEYCNKSFTDDSSPKTTSVPLPDPLPSKQTILAISGGVGGALLLIIVISSVCFCRRLKHAKKRQGSFSETSSKCNSDVIRENKTMENIPLELGNSNPGFTEEIQETDLQYPSDHTLPSSKKNPLYRDSSDDERMGYHQTDREPRYQDNFRTQQESLNNQKFPERPRANSQEYRQRPGENSYYRDPENPQRHQRAPENDYRPPNRGRDVDDRRERASGADFDSNRYVYIEGDGGVRRLFKRVEEDGSAGSTLIYQPSNMPRPIQRENVGSVGDNFSMRAAPPMDERRSSFYDTIDTESTYKIQRPTIKHNILYS